MKGEITRTAGVGTVNLFANSATFKGNITPFIFVDTGIYTNAAGGTVTMGRTRR